MLCLFFFNDTATTEIYTLSLHDALPICPDDVSGGRGNDRLEGGDGFDYLEGGIGSDRLFGQEGPDDLFGAKGNDRISDRKSTRLNSSHANISYAVFCLKKKITDVSTYII